jgi:hypothetical protein
MKLRPISWRIEKTTASIIARSSSIAHIVGAEKWIKIVVVSLNKDWLLPELMIGFLVL